MFLTVNTTQTIFTSCIVKTAALLYLHPRLCEPVQFLQIHIVSRGAVKQTGQHDQPHDSSCWFRPWTRTLLGSAQLGSALFCSAPGPAATCRCVWGELELRTDDVRRCHVRISCHVKYFCHMREKEAWRGSWLVICEIPISIQLTP